MKVNVVVPSFYPATVYGGPIFSILGQCRALAELGVQVDVSTTNANGNCKLAVKANAKNALSPNLDVTYYDDTIVGRFSWAFLLSSWRSVLGSDVIHVQDIFSTYIPPTLVVARLTRKPVLISPRGVLSPWSLGHKRKWAKKLWLATLFDPFVKDAWWHATSDDELTEIRQLYPGARVEIIPNGFDLEPYATTTRPERRAYMQRFAGQNCEPRDVIVSMGRLHEKKGFDLLIGAFSQLVGVRHGVKLLIGGGDDGQLSNLQKLVGELGLKESVHFVGPLDDTAKVDFLLGADAFALCSHSENFGNVYVEALAAGLPIVATWGTPWREVESRGCGRWVEARSDSVASALWDVLRMDHDEASRRARAFAAEFSNERVGVAFLNVYSRMLAKG